MNGKAWLGRLLPRKAPGPAKATRKAWPPSIFSCRNCSLSPFPARSPSMTGTAGIIA